MSKQKNQQDTMTKADGMRENEPSPMSKQKNQQDTMTKADGMRENEDDRKAIDGAASAQESKVMDKEQLKAEQEAQQKRLQYLKTELDRVSKQKRLMELNKRRVNCKDILLREVSQARKNIVKEITQLQECLSKNPFYEGRSNLDQQARLSPIKKTEAKDEGSTKVERKEESKITKGLGGKGDENEISKKSKEKEGSHGQKLMITPVLKKDNIQVEKKESEIEESQKESSQSSSKTCSLRKTETDNQSQDHDLAASKAESTEGGKCRESKPQSGNTDSKQKVTVTETQNPRMSKRKQRAAAAAKLKQQLNLQEFKTLDQLVAEGVAKVQQQFQSFDNPQQQFQSFDNPQQQFKSFDYPQQQFKSFDYPQQQFKSFDYPQQQFKSFDYPQQQFKSFDYPQQQFKSFDYPQQQFKSFDYPQQQFNKSFDYPQQQFNKSFDNPQQQFNKRFEYLQQQFIKSFDYLQQQFKSFDNPHCHPLFTLPPGPPLPHPGSGFPYNMCIPPFSDSLKFTLHRATEERQRNMKRQKR
ncbi:PREDICTED: mediator of RNA polymerase II transcription subunit 15-like isoform X2 [Gekko japonicus]|uniref:Mediator of RNA polymerase II transcription subunit 15-like isoform X2 n=1 Tax=Gekko japonicus TaxID=146911 RepID=A0ABM1JKK2_GEKJA|nr:PREDICTED: mediator of RNA polymerase II transcription subunit 15-like isoform X2 [Gekko japonicus]